MQQFLNEPDAFVWFDVLDPKDHDIAVLENTFKIHPAAITEAIEPTERPEIAAYQNYWLLEVHGVSGTAEEFTTHEIAIIVSEKYLITVRTSPAYPLQEIERRWLRTERQIRRDVGTLLYTILDTLIDSFSVLAQNIQENVAEIEEQLFTEKSAKDYLRYIFETKRAILRFQRDIQPMRDMLAPIVRGDIAVFRTDEMQYYRDVLDHTLAVMSEIGAARDALNSALDIQVSLNNSHQAEINKQLTLIATIFLPLTYLTGFFGQNFGWMVDNIKDRGQFMWIGIGSEVLLVLAILSYLRVKKFY